MPTVLQGTNEGCYFVLITKGVQYPRHPVVCRVLGVELGYVCIVHMIICLMFSSASVSVSDEDVKLEKPTSTEVNTITC
jgi:hypothetical protein